MNVSQFLVICGILLVVVLVLLLLLPPSQGKAGTPTSAAFRDDDQYWHWGFYNNSDDPALMVSKRYGLGWVMNYGHPRAKLVLITALALMLVLALLGVGNTALTGCRWIRC